jgi:hypothetical protein
MRDKHNGGELDDKVSETRNAKYKDGGREHVEKRPREKTV